MGRQGCRSFSQFSSVFLLTPSKLAHCSWVRNSFLRSSLNTVPKGLIEVAGLGCGKLALLWREQLHCRAIGARRYDCHRKRTARHSPAHRQAHQRFHPARVQFAVGFVLSLFPQSMFSAVLLFVLSHRTSWCSPRLLLVPIHTGADLGDLAKLY